MSSTVFFTNAVAALLLPPLNLILVCLVGVCLLRRRPRLGYFLSVGALLSLVVLSTKAGALLLVAPLEKRTAPLAADEAARAQAIVVLGAGRIARAPEFGGHDSPSYVALARLRYAAKLQRETGAPILVTGGRPDGAAESEAAVMARVLREEFRVPVQWLEEQSQDTAQNAAYSAAILGPAGIKRILLVTDAIHMPRSRAIFERAGFEVIAAPTVFFHHEPLTPLHFLPEGEGLRRSHYGLHEWIGLVWYGLRHGSAVFAVPSPQGGAQ